MLPSRRTLARYPGAVAIVVLATLIRQLLDPYLGDRGPLITYFVSVALSAWLIGAGPGLVTLILGGLASKFFFMPPRGSLLFSKPENLLGLAIYYFTGLVIVLLSESQRVARAKAEKSAGEALDRQILLEAEVARRERVEREREVLLAEQFRLRGVAEEQSATLASLFDQAPVGIAFFDADLRFVRANLQTGERLGKTPDQLIGRAVGEVLDGLLPEADILGLLGLFRQAIETGEPFSAKGSPSRLARPDGRTRYSDWSLRRVERPEAGAFGLLFISVDVTEDVHRALALRESEERFRLAADAVDGLIYDVDIATGRVDRTRGLFQLVGYQPDEVPSTVDWWLDQVHPEDLRGLLRQADGREGVGGRSITEYRVRHREGHYIHVLDRSIATTGPQGEVARYVGCTQDVTEIRRAEQSLREAGRRKDEFLAVLSHEIRNPLASIRNSLHLMRRHAAADGPEAFDHEPERAIAERQVDHLARLIDDLMDVARISRGRVELRKEPVELATILNRSVEAARSPIRERGHELSVALPEGPVRLLADPTRLEQVFGNLLNNAIKYTRPGGRIWLSAVAEDGEVVVKVRDSGLGIEPEMLPKVFEMFVQDESHSGHAQGGLGIGLGLSKTLVEMHGGQIGARSDGSDKGTEFAVRLPILEDTLKLGTEPSRTDGRPPSTASTPSRRILVVDDNEDAAKSLAKILSRIHGQDVRIAHDGPSALSLADDFRPEVILLDIGLPEMDGCEVARRLRERPEFATTLLIALTGWGQESDRRRSEAAGIDRHLVKPVDPDLLGDLIAGASRT